MPFPDDGALPWASGAASMSQLEQRATEIAGKLAGKPGVEIRCEGETEWKALAAQYRFDARFELGYVIFYLRGASRVPDPNYLAELSPFACYYLQRFALADPKPTKCETVTRQTQTVFQTVQVKKKVRVKVGGKWVTRTVITTKQVPRTVVTEVKGPPAPCYAGGSVGPSMPASFWEEYENFALAILTLAHEAMHLGGVFDEDAAECSGLQWMPYVAEQLGATPDDARVIVRYALDKIYPQAQGTEYWSSDCREGGPMDLTPGDGVWP